MTLEEILMEFGATKPFKKNGELSESGAIAWEKMIRVVGGLHHIGQ